MQVSAANIARFKSGSSKLVNRSSLSELLVSFFAKVIDFSHILALNCLFPLNVLYPLNMEISLLILLCGCMCQFSDINVKAQELGVCPFNGRWENISSNTRWLPKTYSLYVKSLSLTLLLSYILLYG